MEFNKGLVIRIVILVCLLVVLLVFYFINNQPVKEDNGIYREVEVKPVVDKEALKQATVKSNSCENVTSDSQGMCLLLDNIINNFVYILLLLILPIFIFNFFRRRSWDS